MNLRPLMAYLPWHARDVAVKVFAPFLLFFVMAGLPLAGVASQLDTSMFSGDPRLQEVALRIWGSTASLSLTIGALLLMSGSFALDRERQYVRILFAHQVSPVAFYIQRFAVGLTLFALSFTLVPVLFSQVVTVPVLSTLLALLLTAFFVGSMMLLVGAITQRDGLLFIVTYLLATLLQNLTQSGIGPKWLHGLSWMLPPVKQLTDVSGAWLNGRTVAPVDLVLVLGYGLGMFLSALLLIKRAPLVR